MPIFNKTFFENGFLHKLPLWVIRTYIGYDVAEYPDSNKILLAPSFEIFDKDSQVSYFDGEKNIKEKWKQIRKKQ